MPTLHRLMPTARATSQNADMTLYHGYLQRSEGDSWVNDSAGDHVQFELHEVIYDGPQEISGQFVESITTEVGNIVDIVRFQAERVEHVDFGGRLPYALFGENGDQLDLPARWLNSDDHVVMDMTEVIGGARVYLAKWETVDLTVSGPITVPLSTRGYRRPVGVQMTDGTITDLVAAVYHENGNSLAVFDEAVPDAECCVVLEQVVMYVPKMTNGPLGRVWFRGEYPLQALGPNGTVLDRRAKLWRGSTALEVFDYNNTPRVLGDIWMYNVNVGDDELKQSSGGVLVERGENERTLLQDVYWSQLIGKPGSGVHDIDRTVNLILNVWNSTVLNMFQYSQVNSAPTRNGAAFDKFRLVQALPGTIDGRDVERFVMDASAASCFFFEPTKEYEVAFVNVPAGFTHEIDLIIKNGGAYPSTWHGRLFLYNRMEESGNSGYDMFTIKSAPGITMNNSGFTQVFINHVGGMPLGSTGRVITGFSGRPGEDEDINAGYEVGDHLVNNHGDVFRCIDNSIDSAVWDQLHYNIDGLGALAFKDEVMQGDMNGNLLSVLNPDMILHVPKQTIGTGDWIDLTTITIPEGTSGSVILDIVGIVDDQNTAHVQSTMRLGVQNPDGGNCEVMATEGEYLSQPEHMISLQADAIADGLRLKVRDDDAFGYEVAWMIRTTYLLQEQD